VVSGKGEEPSDEELMLAYVGGQTSALDALYRRYAPLLLRVMQQGLRAPEEARDLVQQTFLQLHRARQDFRPDGRLRPWLFTIAMNLKREHLRRKKRRPETELVLDGSHDPATWGDQGRRDAAEAVEQALEHLSPQQREVIELHWFGGLSFPEIATALGSATNTVKVRAHRGYKAMREALEAAPYAALAQEDRQAESTESPDDSVTNRGARS
jgi:RNA polymerase sigma-70 factor (ECF subfamily)